MKKRVLRALCLICTLAVLCSTQVFAVGAGFSDVPSDSYAISYINDAVNLKIMQGYGNGVFGYGDNVTRAQFATMLVRLFGWTRVNPSTPSFQDDTDRSTWFYQDVETAVKNGAVTADGGYFRPDDSITREDMAVMLVRGLGFASLADSLSNEKTPFGDVTDNKGYIEMAYDFGIIKGTTATEFSPDDFATREQAAAMMIRLNGSYTAKTNWAHAFYAISSYSQSSDIPKFSAVSFGWSSLGLDSGGSPYLNTTSSGGNTFSIPSGYSEVVQLAKNNGVKDNLNVYMSVGQTVKAADGTSTDPCSAVLLNADMRTKAVSAILAELKSSGLFTGVTIDFEEMSGAALKNGFNLFLGELKNGLNALGMPLNVCVAPVTSDGHYYDAYDYRTIGGYADKVILMAHDYAASSLTPSEMASGFTATPPTPFYEIYTALKAVTDADTGVQDKSKIALAFSFGSTEWETVNGKVVNQSAYTPLPSAICSRLKDNSAVINYSDKYQDPYVTYSSGGANYVIWYEDARSVQAKEKLARMFGVDGVSVWRLGIIPDYPDASGRTLYYNVLGLVTK